MISLLKLENTGELPLFNCNACKDKGYIFKANGIYEVATKCKCTILKEIKEKMTNSGIEDLLETKTLENYKVTKDFQAHLIKTAKEYIAEFKNGNRCSMAILGQSGIGKTHILSAVARQLIEENINIRHYTGDDIITTLQANKYDEENYNKEFSKMANAGVLFIDDLFKSSVQNYYNTESVKPDDLREIFKIINYRYNKRLPVLVSSELYFDKLRSIDTAIAGRLNEMCDYKYLVSINPDPSKNYRMEE